jgi:FkbM family methyltransferase
MIFSNFKNLLRQSLIKANCPLEYQYIADKLNKRGYFVKNYSNGEFRFTNGHVDFYVSGTYPWIAFEVFYEEIYKFHSSLEVGKKYSVIDIGANRGYASLYFASLGWCENVYAFELIPQNFFLAEKNIQINSNKIRNKIHIFDYGLGNRTTKVDALYLPHRDGISSLSEDFLKKFAPEEEGKIQKTSCAVKLASTELRRLLDNSENIIIKVDVEGSEYDIFRNLARDYREIFEKTLLIIGETHLGFNQFIKIIKPFGFQVVNQEIMNNHNCAFELARRQK